MLHPHANPSKFPASDNLMGVDGHSQACRDGCDGFSLGNNEAKLCSLVGLHFWCEMCIQLGVDQRRRLM